jgi:hypothetical protein
VLREWARHAASMGVRAGRVARLIRPVRPQMRYKGTGVPLFTWTHSSSRLTRS